MSQALLIAGTGPRVGKTTVAAALLDALARAGYDTAFYKPVISGTDSIPESDAGRVRARCGLDQELLSMTSYVFRDAVSPHLAAAQLMQPVDPDMIQADFATVALLHDATLVEASGGVICPLTLYADGRRLMQTDVMRALGLEIVLVADSGVGTLNASLLSIHYLRAQSLPLAGVILNRFDAASLVHQDNLATIELLGETPVLATVAEGGKMTLRQPFFLLTAED